MPRLTDPDYLRNYKRLRSYRMRGDRVFPLLKVDEQRALFSYYGFHERRARAELLEHRHVISKIYPSLPHRAGRALARLAYLRKHSQKTQIVPEARHRGRPKASAAFSLAVEVRPEQDAQQFARAIIDLAEYLRNQELAGSREGPESEHPGPSGGSQSSGR